MARRQLTRPGFGRRPHRTTNWGRVFLPYTTVAANTVFVAAIFSLSNVGIGEVIRRTRGRIWIGSDQSGANEEVQGGLGMVVANDAALTVGLTALPSPLTEANDDGWFVWESFHHLMRGNAGSTSDVDGFVFDFDSKAMRRVEEGFGIAVIVENNATTGTGFRLAGAISLLSSRIG